MSEPAPEPPTELGILGCTKQGLNLDPADPSYDGELIIFINAALNDLTRLGIGPEAGFQITGPDETWAEMLGDELRYNAAKSFTIIKVRLAFDTPDNYFTIQAFKEQLDKDEWTLNVAREGIDHPEPPVLIPEPYDPFE